MRRELDEKMFSFVVRNEQQLKKFSKEQLLHFLSYVRKIDGMYRAGHEKNPNDRIRYYIELQLKAKSRDWTLETEGKKLGESLIELLELETLTWSEVVQRLSDFFLLLEVLIEGGSLPGFSIQKLLE